MLDSRADSSDNVGMECGTIAVNEGPKNVDLLSDLTWASMICVRERQLNRELVLHVFRDSERCDRVDRVWNGSRKGRRGKEGKGEREGRKSVARQIFHHRNQAELFRHEREECES